MNKFCLLACVAALLGGALAGETSSPAEREKRQFVAPERMMMVPMPVDGSYEQLPAEEMFSPVPASAILPASSRNIDVLKADTEERAGSEPIEVRQYYRPYGGYGGFGSYGPDLTHFSVSIVAKLFFFGNSSLVSY